MTTKATPAVLAKPWLSGHCNGTNPREIHRQCHGFHGDTPCKCGCHRADSLLAHVSSVRRTADSTLALPLEGIGWEDAVRISHELRMARSALSAAEEFLAKHAGELWPSAWKDAQTVEGIGQAQPYRTRNTSWDHDDLITDVLDAHLAGSDGEIPMPFEVIRWLLEAAHIDYWRTGVLERLGVDVDEHRHTTYGTVRLRIKSDAMVGETTREATA